MQEKERTAEEVNILVHLFLRQHFTRTHTLFEEIGVFRGQPAILYRLWESEGCMQSDLADELHLAPATVTKMLQRMEQAGLVERRPDPEDQRVTRVFLTQAGREIQQAIRERERQVGEEMLAGFTAEEREALAGYLERLRDNLLRVNQTSQH